MILRLEKLGVTVHVHPGVIPPEGQRAVLMARIATLKEGLSGLDRVPEELRASIQKEVETLAAAESATELVFQALRAADHTLRGKSKADLVGALSAPEFLDVLKALTPPKASENPGEARPPGNATS